MGSGESLHEALPEGKKGHHVTHHHHHGLSKGKTRRSPFPSQGVLRSGHSRQSHVPASLTVFEGAVYSRDCGLFFAPNNRKPLILLPLTLTESPMARQGKVKVSSLSRHRHGDVIQRVGYPCMNPWMYKAQPRPTYRTGRSPSGVQEKKERPWPGSAPVPEPSLSAGAPGKRESQRGPSITATFRIAGSAAASPALALESIESSTTVLAGASVLCLPHLHPSSPHSLSPTLGFWSCVRSPSFRFPNPSRCFFMLVWATRTCHFCHFIAPKLQFSPRYPIFDMLAIYEHSEMTHAGIASDHMSSSDAFMLLRKVARCFPECTSSL